jgi:hypothetical protein
LQKNDSWSRWLTVSYTGRPFALVFLKILPAIDAGVFAVQG